MLKKFFSDLFNYSTTESKRENYNVEATKSCNVVFKSREDLGMQAPDGSIQKLKDMQMDAEGNDPMFARQSEIFEEVLKILVVLSQQATR